MREHVLELAPALPAVRTERFILGGLVLAITLMGLGVAWDVHWHAVIGRETFWTFPHMVLYSGALLAGILGFLRVWQAVTEQRSRHRIVSPRCLLSRWYGSVALGSAVMVAAAGFDTVWHVTIGDRTIWSPPHVMGVAGAILITLATTVALLRTSLGERPAAPCVKMGGIYLLAALLVAPYFGLLSAALMVFHPGGAGLKFIVTTPYLVAGLASLTLPALVICYQKVLGRTGFEIAALVSIGLWSAQEVFHTVATPLAAREGGYFISNRRWHFPGLPFELLVLAFMLVPVFVLNRLAIRRPAAAGGVLGALYIAEVAIWLGFRETGRGVAALPALGTIISGAISSAPAILAVAAMSALAGVLCSRWIMHGSAVAD